MTSEDLAVMIVAACGVTGADPERVMDPRCKGPMWPEVVETRRAVCLALDGPVRRGAELGARLGWWANVNTANNALCRANRKGEGAGPAAEAARQAVADDDDDGGDPDPEPSAPVIPLPVRPRTPAPAPKPVPEPAPERRRAAFADPRRVIPGPARGTDLRMRRRAFSGSYPVPVHAGGLRTEAANAVRAAHAERPHLKPAGLSILVAVKTGFICSSGFVAQALSARAAA